MKTNTLLRGQLGTGKTRSLETLVNCEISVRVISLEPEIEAVLGHIPCGAQSTQSTPGIHWHYIKPLRLTWDETMRFIKMMNTSGVKALSEASDPQRVKHDQFFQIFTQCQNFTCDRCGAELGCVDDWGSDCALVMDGLTGISSLAMRCLVGAKPFVSLPEYKAGQEAVEALINMCLPLSCSFILLAHTDRELVHETGQVITTVHTIGQKLAPKLTKMFSEVITAQRRGNVFTWSTDEAGEDTKARRLPWSDKLRPDFTQIFR